MEDVPGFSLQGWWSRPQHPTSEELLLLLERPAEPGTLPNGSTWQRLCAVREPGVCWRPTSTSAAELTPAQEA